jgi:hypothetical protein
MNTIKTITAATITGLLSLSNINAAQADELSSPVTMKPLQGISFDVGTKRAVGYFQNGIDHCKLVLTLADGSVSDDQRSFSVTRFEAIVPAAEETLYKPTDGKAIEFACSTNAQTMIAKVVDQVATDTRPVN